MATFQILEIFIWGRKERAIVISKMPFTNSSKILFRWKMLTIRLLKIRKSVTVPAIIKRELIVFLREDDKIFPKF